jgi:catalase
VKSSPFDRNAQFVLLIFALAASSVPRLALGAPADSTEVTKLKAYAATHPDSMALTELSSHHTPTANYFQTTYFSIHTFKFIDAKGTEHLVRCGSFPATGRKR